MRFLALILSVLLLSGFLTGCGTELPEEPEPTPETVPVPVIVYAAEAVVLDQPLGQIEGICPADGGFYAATYKKNRRGHPGKCGAGRKAARS